jgi:hypothetical protein
MQSRLLSLRYCQLATIKQLVLNRPLSMTMTGQSIKLLLALASTASPNFNSIRDTRTCCLFSPRHVRFDEWRGQSLCVGITFVAP